MGTIAAMKSPIVSCVIALTFSLSALNAVYAGSATWNVNPATNDWNTATNWTPVTIPNGPDDTATFGNTSVPNVVIHSDVEVNGVVFTDQAVSYTITDGDASTENVVNFTISGLGIVNNAPFPQFQIIEAAPTLVTNGTRNTIRLKNNAALAEVAPISTGLNAEGGSGLGSVGGQVRFLDNSSLGSGFAQALNSLNGGSGGEIWFLDNSSASNKSGPSNGQLSALGAGTGSAQGQIFFMGTSTGSNASIGAEGGKVFFMESSNAGDLAVSAYGGGNVIFSDTASAGSVALTADGLGPGGTIQFLGDSTGGTAQAGLSYPGNDTLDISGHNPPGVTIGSLVGLGSIVNLGANTLTVGSDNLTTSYGGSIEGSGSVIKIGTGTLTLNGSNTYTGATTVNSGVLYVTNRAGSGTGTGFVNVRTGTLAGNGIIAGGVTIGRRASLEPNNNGTGILTIQGALSLLRASALSWKIDLSHLNVGRVLANGVTISTGSRFNVIATGNGTLTIGTSFVVISNTSANPIAGTFSNLPNGGIVNANGNNLQANYEGGGGNDLTLTVVP